MKVQSIVPVLEGGTERKGMIWGSLKKKLDVALEACVIKLLLSAPFKYFHSIFGAKHIRNGKIHIRNIVVRKHYRRAIIIFKASIQKVLDMYARAHKLYSSYRPVLEH